MGETQLLTANLWVIFIVFFVGLSKLSADDLVIKLCLLDFKPDGFFGAKSIIVFENNGKLLLILNLLLLKFGFVISLLSIAAGFKFLPCAVSVFSCLFEVSGDPEL